MNYPTKSVLTYHTFDSTNEDKTTPCQVSINNNSPTSKNHFHANRCEIDMDPFTTNMSSQDSHHILLENDPNSKRTCEPSCLKNRVRYYFMNSYEKFKVKHTMPYKLIITVLNIFIITTQMFNFENHVYNYAQEHRDTEVTLRNVFLKDWDTARDVAGYPASLGAYAVYTKQQFYDHLNFAIQRFAEFEESNLGAYTYSYEKGQPLPLKFCHKYFSNWESFTRNNTVNLDLDPSNKCLNIPMVSIKENFSIKDYLAKHNNTIYFPMLISLDLKFVLNLMFAKSMTEVKMPTCYKMEVDISYDNSQHDGQIVISLSTQAGQIPCQINMEHTDNYYIWRQVTNFLAILMSSILSVLICRSFYKGNKLKNEVVDYFMKSYNAKLSLSDRFEFLNLWFLLTLVGNLFIIFGSIAKIKIEAGTNNDDLYTVCSVLLGPGYLINLVGLLRYVSYFKEYNIMLMTVKRGFAVLLKAMLCALLVFIGFVICGWVVLAPYHSKFVSISTTSETLYSLMYGDDMYATFAIIDTQSNLIWIFSRIYLYAYIFGFICIILSIIIAIVLDVYDNVKLRNPTERDSDEVNLENFKKFSRNDSIENLRQMFLRSGSSKCFCGSP